MNTSFKSLCRRNCFSTKTKYFRLGNSSMNSCNNYIQNKGIWTTLKFSSFWYINIFLKDFTSDFFFYQVLVQITWIIISHWQIKIQFLYSMHWMHCFHFTKCALKPVFQKQEQLKVQRHWSGYNSAVEI